MIDAAAVQTFISKWEAVTLNEKATAQEHFIDLCRLLGQKTPNEADPKGNFFRFEKPLTKFGGKAGFADVWYKGRFAWEYKTKGKYNDLFTAYNQLTLYKGDLENPPVLVACDIATFEVYIEFTGYPSRVHKFTNADLANANTRELLRLVFTDPEQLRPTETQATITRAAAERFAQVARFLEARKVAPSEIAHFFMKVLFALFAEDIKLLPAELLTQSIKQAIYKPEEFVGRTRALFRAMKTGDYFGVEKIPHFNGWLFDDDEVLALTVDELQFLAEAAKLDWSQVDPSIFGTLFERSLDPAKRAKLGLHYTSKDDILLIVEPVLMAPLRREWAEVREQVEGLRPSWETATGAGKQKFGGQMEGHLFGFMERLSTIRVLDPACGSGNFLYVALTQLKDLEFEVWRYAGGVGLTQPVLGAHPAQLYGIEKDPFAAELAQVVVWIGYLQWKRTNGFYEIEDPILKKLDNIQCRDALLTVGLQGAPAEPEWPEADVIVGNPPFLGGNKVRKELGNTYLDALFTLYEKSVPGFADLVCYWFERARSQIQQGATKRAGLLATNSIRGGANRKVLERIKQTGDIFMAWSDRDWVLDGAAVRVSMIGFDDGTETNRILDGQFSTAINSDLTGTLDLTRAKKLSENIGLAIMGDKKGGAFDISKSVALEMLSAPTNPNGRPNSDVVRPWANGLDITRSPRDMWIVDFGDEKSEMDAAQYILPFEYVLHVVKSGLEKSNTLRRRWWLHERPRPEMRIAMQGLLRYIGTARVAKHRLFVFLDAKILPDSQIIFIARNDDYFLGVLHSKLHELWALRLGTSLEDRPRYTPTTTFETYPFPWPPGKEPQDDPKVQAIAKAARELVRLRDEWLNPKDDGALLGVNLKDRTLTNLYNRRPDWLTEAHRRLDAAVFDAYGWPHDLSDDEILARLLALNLERAAGHGEVPVVGEVEEELSTEE